jgi:hypothetical protein
MEELYVDSAVYVPSYNHSLVPSFARVPSCKMALVMPRGMHNTSIDPGGWRAYQQLTVGRSITLGTLLFRSGSEQSQPAGCGLAFVAETLARSPPARWMHVKGTGDAAVLETEDADP